jgi:hypothetical protein
MGITYGDHLIDSGYYDITPEQEREMESEDIRRKVGGILTHFHRNRSSPLCQRSATGERDGPDGRSGNGRASARCCR